MGILATWVTVGLPMFANIYVNFVADEAVDPVIKAQQEYSRAQQAEHREVAVFRARMNEKVTAIEGQQARLEELFNLKLDRMNDNHEQLLEEIRELKE